MFEDWSNRPRRPPASFSDYYNSADFDPNTDPSWGAARVIAPIIVEQFKPRTIIDVGCGIGAWLRAFGDLGVPEQTGVDGDYVDTRRLLIPADRFVPHDLRQPLPPLGLFDVAICVEVAEHLPTIRSADLVRALTELAPVVLFSAAIPHQAGLGHINEREPGEWIDLFGLYGYSMFDVIRPQIWCDRRVAWWYRQNIVLFLSRSSCDEYPQLERYRDRGANYRLLVIREEVYKRQKANAASLGQLLRSLPSAVVGSLKRRMEKVADMTDKRERPASATAPLMPPPRES